MKIKQSIWFWILQFLGWGFITSVNIWGKIVARTELSKLFIYLEGFGFFVSGIIASLVIRTYLKRHISFDKLQTNEIKNTLIALLMGSITLFILLLFSSYLFYYVLNNKIPEVNNIQLFSTILNSFLFIIFWMLFYLSIKISIQFRKNRIERLELESSLKESQLNTLIGQVNPHFMFNSLNNIRALMLEDVDKSREMITRLSEILRYSLTKNNQNKIKISQELEMVESYIELNKIQFDDRLIFNKNIDNSILNIEIPPMIIQMLIENGIKHGISNLTNGGSITLNIYIKTNSLIIQVINSGKLITTNKSTRVGLKNIKKRLSLTYGTQFSFSISEKENTVIAVIKIPLNE